MATRRKKTKSRTRRYTRRRNKGTNDGSENVFLGILGLFILTALWQGTTVLDSAAYDTDFSEYVVLLAWFVGFVLFVVLSWLLLGGVYRWYRKRAGARRVQQQKIETYEAVRARNAYNLIDWRQLEEYVGYVFEQQGYETTVTQGSGDGGLDAILRKDGQTTVVQVKHYKANVGRPDVQKFVGAMHGYDAGIFVTTSDYTAGAYEYADTISNLKLLTGRELKAMHDTLG